VSQAPASGRISPLRLLQVTTLVSTLDRFAMPPMLVAIAASLDVPLTQVVTAAGAYFLVYGLGQPLWGFASDRFGRVRVLRTSLVVAGVLSLVSALSPTVLVLGVLRGLAGGFFGAAYPSALIYLGDTVAPARRQQAITGLMVGVAVGTAAASAGAGLLADVATWRLPFVLTGSAALVLSVLLARLPEPAATGTRVTAGSSLATIARSRVTLLVLLFAFVEGVVLLGALTLLPTAVESSGATTTVAGAVTGVYGLAVLLGSSSVGRLSLAWHPARLILLGAACAALATALLAVSQSPAVAVVVAVLLGLAWPAMHSSLQTWATEVLPSSRAVVVSFFAASLFVGSAIGAILVAGLVDAGRFAVVFGAYSALAVPLGIGAWAARRRWQRPVELPEP
jgi:predicted MFS family arabinose efflux permease